MVLTVRRWQIYGTPRSGLIQLPLPLGQTLRGPVGSLSSAEGFLAIVQGENEPWDLYSCKVYTDSCFTTLQTRFCAYSFRSFGTFEIQWLEKNICILIPTNFPINRFFAGFYISYSQFIAFVSQQYIDKRKENLKLIYVYTGNFHISNHVDNTFILNISNHIDNTYSL